MKSIPLVTKNNRGFVESESTEAFFCLFLIPSLLSELVLVTVASERGIRIELDFSS